MKIIHGTSHLDHDLTEDQINYIAARYEGRDGHFIDTFELPEELGTVPCGLYGPIMGDPPVEREHTEMKKRGNREYLSRVINPTIGEPFIADPMTLFRQVQIVTVIAGPHKEESCILYTAFGGPLAPQEPLDIEAQIIAAHKAEREEFEKASGFSKETKKLQDKIEELSLKRH